jgi:hypothetical protein
MQDWQKAAVKRFPFLEYDPVVVRTDSGSVLAPAPQRQPTESEISSYMAAAEHAANNIRFTTGITKSAQGIDDRSAKSGVAKRADAAESDNSAFDWHSSGAITLGLLADGIVDVGPKIIQPNEIIQILDEQDKQKSVLVNADIQNNPKVPKGQDVSHFLDRGEYRVRVSAAPSNESMRKETEEKLAGIYENAPPEQQVALTAPLIRASSINGKEELAERVELPEYKKPKDGATVVPPEAQAVIETGKQLLDIAKKTIDELTTELESKKAELASKEKIAASDNLTKLEIERIKQEGAERERQMNENIEGLRQESSRISAMLDTMMQSAQMSQSESEAALDRSHQAGMQSEQLTAQQQAAAAAASQGNAE